ncbi:MAG: hypothetical protein LBS69_01455 [Prevotellaceae bacterium]|jgi:hypothetical protein|nr:hypothetical protein [Prevotellaceae bacterium]
MNKKILFSTLLTIATVFSVSAQRFKPVPNFLKGQTVINVVFDYSNTVFDGDSQEEYYEDKSAKWIKEWEGNRRETNDSYLLDNINDELEKINIQFGDYPDAQYTMIIDVVDCDFGAYAGPFSVPAKLKCTFNIVETGTSDVLSTITLKESQNSFSVIGTPIDFDRMYLAFGEVGEELGEKLFKILK